MLICVTYVCFFNIPLGGKFKTRANVSQTIFIIQVESQHLEIYTTYRCISRFISYILHHNMAAGHRPCSRIIYSETSVSSTTTTVETIFLFTMHCCISIHQISNCPKFSPLKHFTVIFQDVRDTCLSDKASDPGSQDVSSNPVWVVCCVPEELITLLQLAPLDLDPGV